MVAAALKGTACKAGAMRLLDWLPPAAAGARHHVSASCCVLLLPCREIVVRRPHEFKIACLQDIRALFPTEWNPFYAGFGNRDTDEVAYR